MPAFFSVCGAVDRAYPRLINVIYTVAGSWVWLTAWLGAVRWGAMGAGAMPTNVGLSIKPEQVHVQHQISTPKKPSCSAVVSSDRQIERSQHQTEPP